MGEIMVITNSQTLHAQATIRSIDINVYSLCINICILFKALKLV